MDQTKMPSEIVLVKDGPLSGELDEVISEFTGNYPNLFKIIVLPENKGLGNALSIGVLACSTELIARMDTDDISLPERFKIQLEYFEKILFSCSSLKFLSNDLIKSFYNSNKDKINNTVDFKSIPKVKSKSNKIQTAATAGIVKPILANADPKAKFKLDCKRFAFAALKADKASGSNTTEAITIPTTDFGAPNASIPFSILGDKVFATKTTNKRVIINKNKLT